MESRAAPGERRSPTPAAVRKREAIRRLTSALDDERVVLEYQPIVETNGGRVIAVEALLRWRDGAAGEPLAALVHAAERSPVIVRLENWTLGQALRDAAAWQPDLPGLRVHVNVSVRELPRGAVADRVMSHLREAGVPPHLVVLEITETSGIHDFDGASRQVARLAEAGLELWLDDFGTGHSTLEWLCRLPCHGIKLPGAFVDHLPADARSRTIVTHAIALAHDLGLRVIAECVEQEAQRELLEAEGCDALQGFLFHPALPAAALPRALAGRLGRAEEGPRP